MTTHLNKYEHLKPVEGVVMNHNNWPTLVINGSENDHIKHAGARPLYLLTEKEVIFVNRMRSTGILNSAAVGVSEVKSTESLDEDLETYLIDREIADINELINKAFKRTKDKAYSLGLACGREEAAALAACRVLNTTILENETLEQLREVIAKRVSDVGKPTSWYTECESTDARTSP